MATTDLPYNAIVTRNIKQTFDSAEGVTQESLADTLGMSQESVSRYLRGRSRWTIDMIFAWAAALGADVTALIFDKAQQN
jgi:transcriptional regulator with XRE-family HTH domain